MGDRIKDAGSYALDFLFPSFSLWQNHCDLKMMMVMTMVDAYFNVALTTGQALF